MRRRRANGGGALRRPPELRRPRRRRARQRLPRRRQAYADFSATRLSDVNSRQKLVNSGVYSEYLRPYRIEAEVLELVAAGLTNGATAERLWISPGTVKKHLKNVYAKLGVANRAAAVVSYRRTSSSRRT
jgi:DNA-binding CsgD family transcriptional regulator